MTGGGGYIWIQTVASVICNSKNIDEMNIVAINYVIRYDPSIRLAVCLCISMSLSLSPSFISLLFKSISLSVAYLPSCCPSQPLPSLLPPINSFIFQLSFPPSVLPDFLTFFSPFFLPYISSFVHSPFDRSTDLSSEVSEMRKIDNKWSSQTNNPDADR